MAVFGQQPEQRTLASADGLLQVRGLMRDEPSILIQTLDAPSHVYEISIGHNRSLEDVMVSFFLEAPEVYGTLQLLDPSQNTWTSEALTYDAQNNQLFTHLDHLTSTRVRVVLPSEQTGVDNEDLLY